MRKNCATPSLAVSKQPCTFCALTTLRNVFSYSRSLVDRQFKTVFFVLFVIAEKNALSAHPFASDTLDSSTDLAHKMKASQFGRQRRHGALLHGSANLTAKKYLRCTNQVRGSKKFCTA